jgi:hypothetical protein
MKLKIKNPKRFWWISGSLFLIVVIMLTWVMYNKNPFRSDWSYFSETCQVVQYPDGRLNIYNNEFNEFTTEKLNWIAFSHESDTLTVFSLKGKRGYLNLMSGKIQIKPTYRHAWQFSEDLAAVDDKGKIGFIDSKGITKIPFRFFSPHPFKSVADFLFKNGYCTMIGTSGKYGLIDKKGNWAIAAKYDFVNNPVIGYRIVKLARKYGLLDSRLKLILHVEYDWIEIQKDGFRIAKNGGQQLISFDTKSVLKPFVYDSIVSLQYGSGRNDSTGTEIMINTNCFAYNVFTKWGLMKRDGTVVTKAIYDGIEGLSNNLFSCTIENYKFTINENGKIIQ